MDGASLFQGASDVGGLPTSSTPYQRLWLLWLRFFLRFSQVLAHSLSPPVQHNKVVERGRQPWKAGMIDCSHHKGSRQKHQEHVYPVLLFFSTYWGLSSARNKLRVWWSEVPKRIFPKAKKHCSCNPIIPRSISFQIYKGFLSFLQSCSHLLLPLLCPGELLSQLTKPYKTISKIIETATPSLYNYIQLPWKDCVSLKCAFPLGSFPRLRPRISLLASSLLSSSSWSIHQNLLFKTFKKSSKKQIEKESKKRWQGTRKAPLQVLDRIELVLDSLILLPYMLQRHPQTSGLHSNSLLKKRRALSDTIFAGGKASKKIVLWFRVWTPISWIVN